MKLLRNSLYTMAGSGFPLVVTFLCLPWLVSSIGLERYGALSVAWLLLGYFTSADFGFGRALTHRIASIAPADTQARATAIWSATTTLVGLTLVISVGLYFFADWYFSSQFEAGDEVRSEIGGSVWMLAICTPLLALNGLLAGALMGTERFGHVAVSAMISNSSMQLLPLLTALAISTDLRFLIAAALLSRLIGLGVLVVPVIRVFFANSRLAYSLAEARRLGRFGAWVFVTALVGPIIIYVDRLAIGALEGAAAAAVYAIPFQIASRTLFVPFAVSNAIFPTLANESARGTVQKSRDATLVNMLAYTPICVGLIALADPLLRLWLGSSLDPRSIAIAQVILFGCWFNALGGVAFSHIQARGFPRFTATLHLAELPFYIAALFWLGTAWGLLGFAAAFGLRALIDSAILLARAELLSGALLLRLLVPLGLLLASLVSGFLLTDRFALLMIATVLGAISVYAFAALLPHSALAAIREQDMWKKSRLLQRLF